MNLNYYKLSFWFLYPHILLLMELVITWTIFLSKLNQLRNYQRQLEEIEQLRQELFD